jgi:hypothetical protein
MSGRVPGRQSVRHSPGFGGLAGHLPARHFPATCQKRAISGSLLPFSGLLSLFYLPIGFRPRRRRPAIWGDPFWRHDGVWRSRETLWQIKRDKSKSARGNPLRSWRRLKEPSPKPSSTSELLTADLGKSAIPENALALFWPKVHPPRRIQPAALVRANGRRQAIAALQDGWCRWPHTFRHIQSSTNSAKSFSDRIGCLNFEVQVQWAAIGIHWPHSSHCSHYSQKCIPDGGPSTSPQF